MKVICTTSGKCPDQFPYGCGLRYTDQGRYEAKGCPYYTRTGLAEVIDWPAIAEGYRSTFGLMDDRISELFDLSQSLIACYEELAGEHRVLQKLISEGVWVGDSVEKVVMPVAAPEQVSVRPYVRAKPRRSKAAVDAPQASGLGNGGDPGTDPPQTQLGEATEALGMVCHPVSVGPQPEAVLTTTATEGVVPVYIIPQSDEEGSE